MEKIEGDNNQGKRVIIGLSGGVSSYIAAYLLKIQKFELIGVTVVQRNNTEARCHLSEENLGEIAEFCRRLNIPHHIVEADEIFVERVQNQWVSTRLELKTWNSHCFSCQSMRLNLLYEKMIELNGDLLSTGHYAKVFKTDQEISVHSVHDLSLDQSHLLQSLDKEVLASLLLPLSSLGSSEIEKLTHNFSLTSPSKASFKCFSGENSRALLDKFSGKKEGEIITPTGEKIADHAGVLTLEQGQLISTNSIKHFAAFKLANTTQVIAVTQDYLTRAKIKLIDVLWAEREEMKTPFYAYLNYSTASYKVKVYPRSLGSVSLELPERISLTYGEVLTLHKKKGGNAKIVLSGRIEFGEDLANENKDSDQLEYFF